MSGGGMPPLSLKDEEHVVAEIVGPFLIGALVNMFLFGAVYIQTYIYARTGTKDPLWRKLLVAVVFVLDTFHVVLLGDMIWIYAIRRSGNLPAILVPTFFPFGFALIIGAIIIAITQVFFSWRVWKISGNWTIAAISTCTSLAQIAFTIATVIFTNRAGSFTKLQDPKIKITSILFTSFAIATDTMNFTALAWYLHKRRGPFRDTNDVLARLTRVSIQTGAILVVYTIADIVTYLAVPNSTTLTFLISLPNLYTNCLMSSLNARVDWGDGPDNAIKVNLSIPVPSMFRPKKSGATGEDRSMDLGTNTSYSDGTGRTRVNGSLSSRAPHMLPDTSAEELPPRREDNLFPTPAMLEDGLEPHRFPASDLDRQFYHEKGIQDGSHDRASQHALNLDRQSTSAADADPVDDTLEARAI